MRGYSVAAYAQNLGIFLLELAKDLPERGSLGGSTRGEIEHVEGQHHVLLTLVLAEGYIAFADRRQGEIGGGIADLCRHIPTFLCNLSTRLLIWLPHRAAAGNYTLQPWV